MAAEEPKTEDQEATHEEPVEAHVDTWRTCIRPAFAEFVGSGLFVYVACGAAANTSNFLTPGPVAIAIALAFGLTLFTLCFMIGHISGGHLNPVISIVFVFLRKISKIRGVMYVLAQFLGTLVGAALLRASTPPSWTVILDNTVTPPLTTTRANCLATNMVNPDVTPGVAFLVEIILTFFLLMVVCAATDSNKSNQTLIPLAIGVCVTCCHLMALPVDGCSLNPTRSFASAAVSNSIPNCGNGFKDHWVFWLGPLIGGALGAVVYEFVFYEGGARGEDLVKVYRLDKIPIIGRMIHA